MLINKAMRNNNTVMSGHFGVTLKEESQISELGS